MAKEYSLGLTEESTMECGRMVSSMERVFLPNPVVLRGEVCGTKEREQNGWSRPKTRPMVGNDESHNNLLTVTTKDRIKHSKFLTIII